MRATTNEASRTSSGYRTVPRLDIPCSSMMRVFGRYTAGYRTVPRLDIPCSSITLYFPFHRPGYLCQSEPGDVRDVHMPFEHCLPIHGFDQLELISGGQAG